MNLRDVFLPRSMEFIGLSLDWQKKKEGCKWNQKWKRWHYNWWHRNKKRMISDYCEQLYSSKLGKLEGMEAFLETYTQPRLNHEDTENLSRLATSQEIESIIKNVPQKKSPGPDGFTENSTKHLKKTWCQYCSKFSKILKKREHSQTHFVRPVLPR